MTIARLYGRTLTNSSLSVVTAGFKSALESAGVLAGVYNVDTRHLDLDDSAPTEGALAPHGIYTGPLDRIGEMFEQGQHRHYRIMLAPNSNLLPQKLVDELKRYRDKYDVRLMTPSAWASRVVAALVPSTLVLTVPHGVSPEYQVQPELAADLQIRYGKGEFRVLHFSTSAQARKGTVELIRDWPLVTQAIPEATLLCILDYPAKLALLDRLADEAIELSPSVYIKDRADLPPGHMARVLASAHVVCQPSRGEAFGLVPLEALCCGVPVVATRVTGHTEYLKRGMAGLEEVRVPRAFGYLEEPGLEPLDDLPGSVAPKLVPGQIATALLESVADFPGLQEEAIEAAPRMQQTWSWNNQLSLLISELKREA